MVGFGLPIPAGATVGVTGPDLQAPPTARGISVVLDMTNVGTGSVTLTIEGKDPTSGKYFTLLAGVAIVANSTTRYVIYPGLTAAANSVVSDVIPGTFRLRTTANNANPATYTVGGVYLP